MNDVDMCHVMIDLETLSTKSNGVILSIGAVRFDLKGNTDIRFHKGISINSCLQVGLKVDGDTIEWWLSQSYENIARLMNMVKNNPNNQLGTVLTELRNTFELFDKDKIYVWSHGSNFDIVLLENAYKAIGGKAWWKYSHVRDTRTLFDLVNYKYTAKGEHDALEDAMNQAKAVCEAYAKLKLFIIGGGEIHYKTGTSLRKEDNM